MYYYKIKSDCCIGVPKGSAVELSEVVGDRVAFRFDNKWYGYYSFSLFEPLFKSLNHTRHGKYAR